MRGDRIAIALALAVSGQAGAAEVSLQDALLKVEAINIAESDGRAMVTDIMTSFGRSIVRTPDFVTTGSEWASKGSKARASLRLADLNLLSEPEAAENLFTGPTEAAVMFWRGYASMEAGPDIFIFDQKGKARGVSVVPVFRMPDESLVEGVPATFDANIAMGQVKAGGKEFYGVGIDLDAWVKGGHVPEGAMVAGVVVRHDGSGDRFEPAKFMMAQPQSISSFETRNIGGGRGSELSLKSGGGARNGGSGGANPRAREVSEVPSPGVALTIGMAAGIGGLRRRRSS